MYFVKHDVQMWDVDKLFVHIFKQIIIFSTSFIISRRNVEFCGSSSSVCVSVYILLDSNGSC